VTAPGLNVAGALPQPTLCLNQPTQTTQHHKKASDVWGALLGEIMSETAAVWQWLMDREVEAPERYSAVQSYRAAMAVLRQQQHFVEVRDRGGCGPCGLR